MCNPRKGLSSCQVQQRRLEAVNLLTHLCRRREVQRHKRRSNRPRAPIESDISRAQLDPFPMKCETRQCPVCIGDESLTYEQRTFLFRRNAILMNHVERRHVRRMPETNVRCWHSKCKALGVVLTSIQHWEKHVWLQHGITLC